MRGSARFVLRGIAIAVNGCGGSSRGDGAGGARGATACGVSVGPASGAACNTVAAGGPCVTGIFSTAAAPTPVGGAFAGGTYDLRVYNEAGAGVARVTKR